MTTTADQSVTNPKVSVLVLTYNHELFIEQALHSILVQEVNFEYELVIGEDCSTDRTREIVRKFQMEHRDKVRLILPEKNLGSGGSILFLQVIKSAKGQYIAWMDGDDYWTDPRKLQKQVDFLDQHPECAICFHDAIVVYEDGSGRPARPFNALKPKNFSTLQDLFGDNYIPSLSVMVRNKQTYNFPDWFRAYEYLDWELHIFYAQFGKLGYLDEVMGVYRVHPGGVWSGSTSKRHLPKMIEMMEEMNVYLNFRYAKFIRASQSHYYYLLARECVLEGDLPLAKAYAWQGVKKKPLNPGMPVLFLFSLWLRTSLPSLYSFYKMLTAFYSNPR